MSIEGQLRQAFREHADTISPPPAVDAAVAAIYRRQAMGRRGVMYRMKSWRMSRVAIAALVVVMLSGFAYAGSKLLYQQEKGHVGMSYRAVDSFTIPPETLESIRIHLNEVKEQLEPGDRAVVYMEDLKIVRKIGLDPILGVDNPVRITTLEAWQSKLAESGAGITLPNALLGGTYSFAEGFEGYPHGSALSVSALELLPELEAESRETGRDVIWRQTDAADIPFQGYTTTYRNGDEQIHYTVEPMKEKMKIESIMNGMAALEKVQVDGYEAAYTYNDNSMFTDSHIYQEIAWLEEQEGQTLIHRVGSDSGSVTKEQLAEAAGGM